MDQNRRSVEERYIRSGRRKRWWSRLGLTLMGLTLLCTLYWFALPAITLEKEGIDTHTQAETVFVPICTLETLKVHSHTESCYDTEQNQICTYTEAMVHVHDQRCFDEAGQLWCPLPELPAHVHEENCYGENGVLQCEKDKLPSHQHGDGCFREQPKQTEANLGETETAGQTGQETETQTDQINQTDQSELQAETAAEPSSEAETQSESQTEVQTGNQTEAQTETQTETETELQSELETEPGAALLGSTYAATPRASVSITYYIYVNGERYTLQTQTGEREKDGERYYVTAEELESVYGKFGFKASAYQGERLFPHTDSNGPNQIWADAAPTQKDGSWRIPLATRTQIYVYYLPANTAGSSSYFTSSKAITDAGMIADNQFFSVSVYEPSGTVANSYVRSGQDLVLTLNKRDDYDWYFYNANTEEALTPETAEQEDGTIRYTVRSVSVPIQVKPKLKDTVTNGSFTILYTADTLKDQKVKLGQFQVGEQIQLSEGSIGGMASASEQVTLSKGESHKLKRPDSETLYVRVWDNRKFTYLFEGWRDKKSGVLLGDEDSISFETLYQHAQDGVVELEAVWSPLDGRGNIRSLNFYLNLACEIMDFGNTGYNPQPQNKFTQSLFHTYVNTSGQNAQFLSDYQLLAPPTTESTAYDVDKILRKMTDEAYKSFTLAQFPSDEEIFAELRAKNAQITLNNEVIPLQYLSTDYFQIRWYVMKYATSDGWHIDGILVAKRAKLNVTKSFLGDPITIEQIKGQTGEQEYTIQIRDNRDSGDVFYLTLTPWEKETRNDQNYYGYHTYNEITDTYTWNLEGHLDGTYTVTENNYLSDSTAAAAFYRVYEAANSQDWQAYTGEGIEVAMKVYPEDEKITNYQTVAFRNYYVKSGNLRLHKVDSFTHDNLSGVSFQIESVNDRLDLVLKRKPGTSMYSALATEGSAYTEEVTGTTVVTDKNGDLFLELLAGTYILTETFPDGYGGAAKIKFTVDNTGKLTSLEADGSAQSSYVSGVGSSTLTVQNESRLLTTVTAKKDWGSIPEGSREDVIVRLMVNGAALSDTHQVYTQTLNAENNWTCIWNNLPLFINGRIAEYTIREVQIGNTAYDSSADASDGYRDYDVTYDPARYREGDTGEYEDEAKWIDGEGVHHYANHVLLTVHNRIAGLGGEIRVTKAFQTQDGTAVSKIDGMYTFGLFEQGQESQMPLQTAKLIYESGTVTPTDGTVVFEGLSIGKTYCVYELGDDGAAISDQSTGTIGRRSFRVLGGGTPITLTSEKPLGTVTITNQMNYAPLPETGGRGTTGYTKAGLLLLMVFWCAKAAIRKARYQKERGYHL